MKKLIVTTDFSAAATHAAAYAADMASVMKSGLVLFHVVQTPIGYSDLPIVINLEDQMRSAERELENQKEILIRRTRGGIEVETEVALGTFFSELKQVCERIQPYAVVMGSQGKTAAEHLMFGAHTVHTVKHLNWPVITVPPGSVFKAIKKIGLASDLTQVVETTPIEEIKLLVHDFNAELHIINTGQKEVFDADIVFESAMMQEMTMSLNPVFHFLNNKNTEEGLIDFVEKNNIDLLLVLPKKHGFIENLFHKSFTKAMVLHSHVPVMALHG